MVAATHAVVHDDRNDQILIGMRDGLTGEFTLVPRHQARVSVFDSAFMLGDGIWEGIRAKRGVVQFAKDHLNRLFESAKAMCEFASLRDAALMVDMDMGCTRAELLDMIHRVLDENGGAMLVLGRRGAGRK